MSNEVKLNRKYNKEKLPFARELRKNMTKEEKRLWYDFLSNYPIRFIRQKIIGPYIADFYCAKAMLVIEVDGSQHYTDEAMKYDEVRTKFIEKYGLKVFRIDNSAINNCFIDVCSDLDNFICERLSELGKLKETE